ncbi:hypothetical protein EJB05_00368, partial [Eragrostis curvula]
MWRGLVSPSSSPSATAAPRISGTAADEPCLTLISERFARFIVLKLLHFIQHLLRLDAPLWLIRAASACKQWRRAVAGADDGAAFLRLARSLHPPTVVGRYLRNGGSVTFVHSSPRPLLPPVSDRFSLDFLPIDLSEWKVVDCHGGLVPLIELNLLHHVPSPSLIVCNPLTRRYQGVGCPPEKLSGNDFADAFLLDGEDGTTASISNFRVLYRFNHPEDPLACVFSMADVGDWRVLLRSADDLDNDCLGHLAGRVDGSLYLGLGTGSVIVLDNASLEFSKVNLPIRVKKCAFFGYRYQSTFRVVHGGAGDSTSASPPPTSRIVHVYGEDVEVFCRVHDNDVGGEWVLEHSIRRLSCHIPMEWPAADVIADGAGFFILPQRDKDVLLRRCGDDEASESKHDEFYMASNLNAQDPRIYNASSI